MTALWAHRWTVLLLVVALVLLLAHAVTVGR